MRRESKTKILTDSEGLRVASIHVDEDEEEGQTLDPVAKAAYEAELAADSESVREEE